MLPEQTGTPEMKERFRREIQLLASLNHPNIASLHNAFYHEAQLIMVMELVEKGENLRTRSHHARIPLPMLMGFWNASAERPRICAYPRRNSS